MPCARNRLCETGATQVLGTGLISQCIYASLYLLCLFFCRNIRYYCFSIHCVSLLSDAEIKVPRSSVGWEGKGSFVLQVTAHHEGKRRQELSSGHGGVLPTVVFPMPAQLNLLHSGRPQPREWCHTQWAGSSHIH